MTFLEAVTFFHTYGNVGRDIEGLQREEPVEKELDAAVRYAVHVKGRDLSEAITAKVAVQRHFMTMKHKGKQ